jgi:hypothetical protein
MSIHFGKEKFHSGMLCLVEAGDIHSRVAAALTQHLLHIKGSEDLPESVSNQFSSFCDSLGIEANGHVSEHLSKMSDLEVEHIAKNIVSLYEKLLTS